MVNVITSYSLVHAIFTGLDFVCPLNSELEAYRNVVKKMRYFKGSVINCNIGDEEIAEVIHVGKNSQGYNLKDVEFILVDKSQGAVITGLPKPVFLFEGVWRVGPRVKDLEGFNLIFFRSGLIDFKWGIPQEAGIMTADGVPVGLSGVIHLEVCDLDKFADFVNRRGSLTFGDLRDLIHNDLLLLLRQEIGSFDLSESSLEDLKLTLNNLMFDSAFELGLCIDSLRILYVAVPEHMLRRVQTHVREEVVVQPEETESAVGLRFCPFCGKKLPDVPVKFCPFCGRKLPQSKI